MDFCGLIEKVRYKMICTREDLLRAEHDVIHQALGEWLGIGEKPAEDLMWVTGVNDFASKLIEMIEETKDGK